MLDPKPMSRHFLGAMLKRATDKTGWILEVSIQDKYNEIKEKAKEDANYNVRRKLEELTNIKKRIEEFQATSGIDLNSQWDFKYREIDPSKLGEAVKFISNGGAESVKKQLIGLQATAAQILETISTHIKTLSNDTGTKDA